MNHTISFRLDKELAARIRFHAGTQKRSVSGFIRWLIFQYLADVNGHENLNEKLPVTTGEKN